jgi:glutamyl-tRNA synthetase
MNGQHLSRIETGALAAVVTPALEAAGLATASELDAKRNWYFTLLELLKVRARTIDDIVRQAGPYFRDEISYDADAVAKQWKDRPATAALLAATREALAATAGWEPAPMEEALRHLAEGLGFGEKAGKIFQPLRVALTGLSVSPGIFDVLGMLGRERSLARIDAAVAELKRSSASATS